MNAIKDLVFKNYLTDELSQITFEGELYCLLAGIGLGLLIALVYIIGNRQYTRSFFTTLVLIPAVVQIIIFLVSDNLGMGVAVAGAFSLIRFRSVPGTAKEICSIFFVTAVGIALGRGYILFAVMITVILALVLLVIGLLSGGKGDDRRMSLRITVPESLEFDGMFDDLFQKHLKSVRHDRVKTTNMGSMYDLRYTVTLKDPKAQKSFIDEIRVRNGNLPVILGVAEQDRELL